ncbi:hypothetical protein NFI96_028222, partial [Prochilodus magdalenae]
TLKAFCDSHDPEKTPITFLQLKALLKDLLYSQAFQGHVTRPARPHDLSNLPEVLISISWIRVENRLEKMDGEFDREIDDGGWGRPGKRPWVTFRVQLDNTLQAAGAVCDRKDKTKKLADIKIKVEQLVKRKGKGMEDRGSLGNWLWEKEKEHKVRTGELEEQIQQAGLLQKPKLKKKAEAQEEERRGWSELAVLWQSVRHLHSEGNDKKEEATRVSTPGTRSLPPPYAPPVEPTPGVYRIMYVNSESLQIGPEEGEARQKVNDKKQMVKGEPQKVMVATEPQPQTLDLYSVTPWAPQPPPYPFGRGGYVCGGYQRGGAGRGRRGSGGNTGRGGYGGPSGCFICNDANHWARDCPQHPRFQRGRGGPTRGSGRGHNPHPQAPYPQGGGTQFPIWEEGGALYTQQ